MAETFTTTDCSNACIALREWFKSQDIGPGESMGVLAMFTAGMIKVNQPGVIAQLERLALFDNAVLAFMLDLKDPK